MGSVGAMRRIGGVNGDAILPAIRARLVAALAAPHPRYRPWRFDGDDVGALDDARATRLAGFRDVFDVDATRVAFVASLATPAARTAALARVAAALRAEGALSSWRDEPYAVVAAFGAAAACTLERGAARYFGLRTFAAHVNGYVESPAGTRLWFARRSATKAIDPGMLDNLVGGGVRAGDGVADTVAREAWEEAGIPAQMAGTARAAGTVHVRRALADGLQDETIFVHDLALPADFAPANQDGEAVEHRLVDLVDAARLIAVRDGADTVTIDASLVVLDFLTRRGVFSAP